MLIKSESNVNPDFMIIGAMRSGTTSLYNYLIQHPKIIPASEKEIHFFTLHYERGLSWYQEQFEKNFPNFSLNKSNEFLTGEGTPAYIRHPEAPKRIAEILPNIKFIALLRNPVERAYSNYKLRVRLGREKLSFKEAIKKQSKITDLDIKKLFTDLKFYKKNFVAYQYLPHGHLHLPNRKLVQIF